MARIRGRNTFLLSFLFWNFATSIVLSSPRLRELLAFWDFARWGILSDNYFGEWQKRGKVRIAENWQIGKRKSQKKRKKKRKRKRNERSSQEKEREAGEVRNVTRNVRQAPRSVDSGMAQSLPIAFLLSHSLRPLLRLRCKGSSERDLVNGICAVRRSSRRATSRLLLPSKKIKASRGPVATNKRSFSRMLAVVFA